MKNLLRLWGYLKLVFWTICWYHNNLVIPQYSIWIPYCLWNTNTTQLNPKRVIYSYSPCMVWPSLIQCWRICGHHQKSYTCNYQFDLMHYDVLLTVAYWGAKWIVWRGTRVEGRRHSYLCMCHYIVQELYIYRYGRRRK